MTPPEAPSAGSDAAAGAGAPADFVVLEPLLRRADFLRLSRGRSAAAGGLILQGRPRPAQGSKARQEGGQTSRNAGGNAGAQTIRVGFTCSRKVGNAVQRNRARRRLREAARQVLPQMGRPGWDYVLVGRRDLTAERPFAQLLDDLKRALAKIHDNGS